MNRGQVLCCIQILKQSTYEFSCLNCSTIHKKEYTYSARTQCKYTSTKSFVAFGNRTKKIAELTIQIITLTLSQCTLAGPLYTGRPLVDPVYTGIPLGGPMSTCTGTPLEKLSWNCPTLECHWRNSDYCSLHWNTTRGTITAHTNPGTYS